MKPFRASEAVRHLVWGPALLVAASLIDLFLATRVFVHPDRMVGALSFFVFGALTGLPCQLALARARTARWLEGNPPSPTIPDRRHRMAARIAGVFAAASTATWLYALSTTAPALIFPLANLSPVIFATSEGLRGLIRGRVALGSALLLLSGLWIFRSPDLGALAALTPAVVAALCVRNLAGAGSELAEKHAAKGAIVQFNALRFGWLVGAGVPLALGFLVATSRFDDCMVLIQGSLPVALPLHMLTMLLTFGGGFYRTRAKALYSLTLCSAANAMPLVLTPAVAVVANSLVRGLFPTAVGSAGLLVGSLLVVSAVVWLAAGRSGQRVEVPAPSVQDPYLRGNSR